MDASEISCKLIAPSSTQEVLRNSCAGGGSGNRLQETGYRFVESADRARVKLAGTERGSECSPINVPYFAGMKWRWYRMGGKVLRNAAEPKGGNGTRCKRAPAGEDDLVEEQEIASEHGFLRPAQEQLFNVYPNPNSGTFTISGADMQQVQIMEASGKLVREMKGPFATNVGVSGLGLGLYMVRVQMADGSVESAKLVVN